MVISPPERASVPFEDVRALLNQRFPFLMVDRVLAFEPNQWIRTIKNVTGNEMHFLGHFPHHAIMPGVLIIESMAQTIGLLGMLSTHKKPEKLALNYLASANVSFHRPVVPGDQLEIEAIPLRQIGRLLTAKVEARVGTMVARGEIVVTADLEQRA